jgi:hypothetical protein
VVKVRAKRVPLDGWMNECVWSLVCVEKRSRRVRHLKTLYGPVPEKRVVRYC